MLLSKTSWRIKQFISHRKTNSHEHIEEVNDERATEVKLPTNHPKRLSWISQTPSSEATSPLRRASSNATSRSLRLDIPTSTTATAHSSASSLCSCDCAPLIPITSPPSSSLSSPKHKLEPRPDILYLPSLTPLSTTGGDARKWQLIFSDPFAAKSPASETSNPNSSLTIAASETLDLLAALDSIDPAEAGAEILSSDNDKTPTQSIRFSEDEMAPPTESDNLSQLIRETDEAFQAVGTALADAKSVGNGWYDDHDPPIVRNFAIQRSAPRRPSASRSPVVPRSPVLPVGRQISVTKAKPVTRFIKRKTNLFGKTLRTVPAPSNATSHWTLTDVTTNMVDVFRGSMFRTEVDEMLTPGRMQKLREREVKAVEKRQSSGSNGSGASGGTDGGTPTEPFHLESLSERISAAQKGKSPPPSPPEEELRLKRLPEGKGLRERKVKFADLSISKPDMTIADLTFPSPPRTPRRPSTSSRMGSAPLLPTIPEVSPLTLPLTLPLLSSASKLKTPSPPASPPPYITLPSTNHTLTAPHYTHGPIRLPHPLSHSPRTLKPLTPLSPDSASPLDWTAFQIAISGTSPIELSWEADESELDTIITWFESLGIGGYGLLIDEKLDKELTPRSEIIRPLSLKRVPSRRGEMGTVPTRPASLPLPIVTEARKVSSASSLPPSPMLDFAVVGEEYVPMGFNLGHDLGDFLRWEQDHVRAL